MVIENLGWVFLLFKNVLKVDVINKDIFKSMNILFCDWSKMVHLLLQSRVRPLTYYLLQTEKYHVRIATMLCYGWKVEHLSTSQSIGDA